MKQLPLSNAVNNQLSGYYSSLSDSETVLNGSEEKWLDLSPFVSYMLDAFERCLIDAALSADAPTEAEAKLLERMNDRAIGTSPAAFSRIGHDSCVPFGYPRFFAGCGCMDGA